MELILDRNGRVYHPQIGPAVVNTLRTRRGKPSGTLRRWIFERDGHRCLECGATDRLTLDHIYPAVCGGTEWASNLRTLCQSCNSRRQGQWVRENGWTFWMHEYRDERGNLVCRA